MRPPGCLTFRETAKADRTPCDPLAPIYDFAKSCAQLGAVQSTVPLARSALSLALRFRFVVAASGCSAEAPRNGAPPSARSSPKNVSIWTARKMLRIREALGDAKGASPLSTGTRGAPAESGADVPARGNISQSKKAAQARARFGRREQCSARPRAEHTLSLC